LLLKRGHAASNKETDIPVSIFPTLCYFYFQENVVAGVISAHGMTLAGLICQAINMPST
jgi:hypothetical protein